MTDPNKDLKSIEKAIEITQELLKKILLYAELTNAAVMLNLN